ncbi:MAG: 30S ribosomal protein S6 [Bacteroidota bacterium]
MKNYEVTLIVDPVLSGEEIKATAQTYVDQLTNEGSVIVHVDEMGLRQLAYPINKRTSGVYFCIEFQVESGELIDKLELALRRDERIMRFLAIRLDKYGVKYNDDKRNGKIGKVKKKEKKDNRRGGRDNRGRDNRGRSRDRDRNRGPKPDAPKTEAPKQEQATGEAVAAKKEGEE